MTNYPEILKAFAWRALFALPFFVIGITGVLWVLSPFCILVGALIVTSPLAELFAEPTGNLFWPSKHYNHPQPQYSIPQSKRARGLYEEAMAGFKKIAEEYPGETQPYVEMLDIAIVNLHDQKRANAIFHRGVSVLKKDEDRETLVCMYRAIQTRLAS